jgi:hypothetical protein
MNSIGFVYKYRFWDSSVFISMETEEMLTQGNSSLGWMYTSIQGETIPLEGTAF